MTEAEVAQSAYEDRLRALFVVYMSDPSPDSLSRLMSGIRSAQTAKTEIIQAVGKADEAG